MTITFTGSNNFLLRKKLGSLQDVFIKEYGDLSVEKIDGEETSLDHILGAIESVPFLSTRKMIIVRSLSLNKQVAEQIELVLDAASDTVDIVFVEPKIDKRSVYYKTLKKRTDMQEFGELDERGLANWLVNEAKLRGAILSQPEAFYLVNRVGVNQQRLDNELTKLTLYSPEITRHSIDALTEPTPQGSIFNLLDAAFAGNSKHALSLYSGQRAQKVEPQAILAMIIWQMHLVTLAHAAGAKSPDEISRDTNISPFAANKSKNIAARLSKNEVIELLNSLCELDYKLKNQSIDADEALKNLIITISS